MKKNEDPRFVLLERADYDRLLMQARVGDGEVSHDNATDKAVAGARRLNPLFDAEMTLEEEFEKARDQRLKLRAAEFALKYKDQEVWLIENHGRDSDGDWRGAVVRPVVITGELEEDWYGAGCLRYKDSARTSSAYVGNFASKQEIQGAVPHCGRHWSGHPVWVVPD